MSDGAGARGVEPALGAVEREQPGRHWPALTRPNRLLSRDEVLARPCPAPPAAGVYAWYFREVPPGVPVEGCHVLRDLALLYVGISPKMPPANGRASRQTLRSRVRYHYRGNAEGSTLRLSLGCLLADYLGIALRRVGSGRRRTFTVEGEARLSAWMAENAFVCWMPHPEPWLVEDAMIERCSLPLNLQGNRRHPFAATLSRIRSEAKERAALLPVVAR